MMILPMKNALRGLSFKPIKNDLTNKTFGRLTVLKTHIKPNIMYIYGNFYASAVKSQMSEQIC